MSKLLLIDEMVINDHYHLRLNTDRCFYYFEYTAEKGYNYSETNKLILNFKKKLDRKGLADFKYKSVAINEVAGLLNVIGSNTINSSTFVPIPPSKSKAHPLYDDRIVQILHKGLKGRNADIRELIYQSIDTEESHISGIRNVLALEKILKIDTSLVAGVRETIILVDDVLTTGCHFIAVKNVLLKKFPDCKIIGLFIARRKLLNE